MLLKELIKRRSCQEWFSSLPVFLLLFAVILAGNGEKIHSRFLQMGEWLWQDYFLLRADIPIPACNPNPDLDKEVAKLEAEASDKDGVEALFEDQAFDREAALVSLQKNLNLCRKKHRLAEQNKARVTFPVIIFRSIETGIAAISMVVFKKQDILLMLLIFICAGTSTIKYQHIAFKPVQNTLDHTVSTLSQLIGNGLLFLSALDYRNHLYDSGTVVAHPGIYLILVLGFAMLSAINGYQLIKPRAGLEAGNGLWSASKCIPLYIFMTFISGSYFFLVEEHWAGLSIFFSLLFDQAGLFLNIGLYIWVGMLLKQTMLGSLVFKAFMPWRMSPELLAVVAIIVMATPTAFTGASGIIIIAMGGIVYKELRQAGARRQLALAATAMTGSAGVVLRPCLLVVLIAALNKEVVTDQLFGWGVKVFYTTIFIFFIYVVLFRREKMHIAPVTEALKPCLKAGIPLIPYVLILLSVAGAYHLLLNIQMDEFSAPVILPIIIMGIIVYEKFNDRNSLSNWPAKPLKAFECTIRGASSESSVHIGALLLLIGLSFATGGVIERSGLLTNIPETFSSVWVTLSFLIVILLGIGMVMDPFGAVVLVSGTVAQIAYKNGIDPVHFWMITLVSFELGYLTPPVALNHLLTRQVIGCNEVDKALCEGDSFWYRNEKMLLPVLTMGTTLLLVAIVPIFFLDTMK